MQFRLQHDRLHLAVENVSLKPVECGPVQRRTALLVGVPLDLSAVDAVAVEPLFNLGSLTVIFLAPARHPNVGGDGHGPSCEQPQYRPVASPS
jgi:hypothetical protein